MKSNRKLKLFLTALITVVLTAPVGAAEPGSDVQGDAARGEAFWNQQFSVKGEQRSCVSCHTADPGKAGRQQNTGKPIEPMAPRINPERFTDAKKIAKWFKRNCKWTVGRECTAQEQADVVEYLKAY